MEIWNLFDKKLALFGIRVPSVNTNPNDMMSLLARSREPTFKKQAIELGTYNDRIVEEAVRSGEYVPPDDEVREEELRCRLVDSADESCNAAGPPPSLNSFLSAICSCMSSTLNEPGKPPTGSTAAKSKKTHGGIKPQAKPLAVVCLATRDLNWTCGFIPAVLK